MDSKVLQNFGGVDDAQFLTEIKKERPYVTLLAERATETVDSIFASALPKEDKPSPSGVAKPKVMSSIARAFKRLKNANDATRILPAGV